MDSQSLQPRAYEAQHAQANRAELVERIARTLPDDGRVEPLNGLYLFRASSPTELLHSVYTPAFCVIAQGSKEVFLGEERYQYDPAHYLLTTVELPVVSQILEASAVTAMSPLQFQKRLRLQEARRLMLGEHLDAASAGSRVGYDDAAHFNREYKRVFGLPPVRDVERLRQTVPRCSRTA